MLKTKMIDALIICSHVLTCEDIASYTSYGPINIMEQNTLLPCVYVDHYHAFTTAREYLHAKGHHSIAYCVARLSGTSSLQRAQSYRDFLSGHDLQYQSDYVFFRAIYFEDGVDILRKWMQMKHPPTALLATNDQVAAGVMTACANENIRVPQDLALIGFDNQPISIHMGITTVEISLLEMGEKLLLQALEHTLQKQEVPTVLIERRTV